MGYSYNLFHYNISSIPIWTWNELSGIGRRSGCMMWPGSNYKYLNRYCTFSRELDKSVSWEERVKTALSWFKHKYTPANLVMMYMEEPDEEGHAFGPEADVVSNKLNNFKHAYCHSFNLFVCFSKQEWCVN